MALNVIPIVSLQRKTKQTIYLKKDQNLKK